MTNIRKSLQLFVVILLPVAGTIGAPNPAFSQEASPSASPPVAGEAIEIHGDVANPGTLSLADIQELPPRQLR
jgi:DMSO/TMAO reductase YedYZ molybdopterin-dependent catalytic subunit